MKPPRNVSVPLVSLVAITLSATGLARELNGAPSEANPPQTSDDPESWVQEKPRWKGRAERTERTLGDILAAAEWTTVADGFVLRVYSDQEVKRINQERDAYESRRRQYLAKRTPLDERRGAINLQLPSERVRAYADMMLRRYDRDNDGVLDAKEQEAMRSSSSDMDADNDGSVTTREFTRHFVQRMRGRSAPSLSVENVPDNWEELQDEFDAISAKIDTLKGEFHDVLEPLAEDDLYKVMEVSLDFVRLRHGQEERVIPFASIREIRRTVEE